MAEEGCLRNAQFSTLVCHDNLIVKTINNEPAVTASTQNTATFVSTGAAGASTAQALNTLLTGTTPRHNAPLADIKAKDANSAVGGSNSFSHPFVNIELGATTGSSDSYTHPLLKITDQRQSTTTTPALANTPSLQVIGVRPVDLGQKGIILGSSGTDSNDITIEMPAKSTGSTDTSGDDLTISAQNAHGGFTGPTGRSATTGGNLILKAGASDTTTATPSGATRASTAGHIEVHSELKAPSGLTGTGSPGNGGSLLLEGGGVGAGATASTAEGGDVSITGGSGGGQAAGGQVEIIGGAAGTGGDSTGAAVRLQGGGGTGSQPGGIISINAGSAAGAGGGGTVSIISGTSNTGVAGNIELNTGGFQFGGVNAKQLTITPTVTTLKGNFTVGDGLHLNQVEFPAFSRLNWGAAAAGLAPATGGAHVGTIGLSPFTGTTAIGLPVDATTGAETAAQGEIFLIPLSAGISGLFVKTTP
jgi:hypothetical protein